MVKFLKSLSESKLRLNELTDTEKTSKKIDIEQVLTIIKPIIVTRDSKDIKKFYEKYQVS